MSSTYFRRASIALTGALLSSIPPAAHVFAASNGTSLPPPLSSRDRFRAFASLSSTDGERFMTPSDFVQSLSIRRPDGSSEDAKKKGGDQKAGTSSNVSDSDYLRKLFRSIDADGDGMLSFTEYSLFFVLLTNSEEELRISFEMMDMDSDGYVDVEGFKNIIKSLAADPSLKMNYTSGFTQMLFGEKYDRKVSLKSLLDMVHRIRHDVWHHEFHQLDVQKKGTIQLSDLYQFIFGSAPKFDNLQEHKDYNSFHVNLSTYMTFNSIILHSSDVVHAMRLLEDGGTQCTKKDFRRALKLSGVKFTANDVDIVFRLFDLNGNGILDVAEFEEVVNRRKCFNTVPVDRRQPTRSIAQDFFYCMQQRSD